MRKLLVLVLVLVIALVGCSREPVPTVDAGLLVSDNYIDTTVCKDCQLGTIWEKDWNEKIIDRMKPLDSVEYIVLHSTSVDADADDVDESMGCRKASWHWTVDEGRIIQAIPVSYQGWHCGSKKRPKVPCYNSNSLSIEMCQSDNQNPDKVIENTWLLLKELKVSFPNAKLVRHFDVTGKACPLLISELVFNKLLQRWNNSNGYNVSTDFDANRQKVLLKLDGALEPVVK